MTVRPVDILVGLAALGVVLFVALLPSPRDNNPAVPETVEHRGLRSERACLRCHAAGAAQALPARHPPRTDCFRCHRLVESTQSKRLKLGMSEGRGESLRHLVAPFQRQHEMLPLQPGGVLARDGKSGQSTEAFSTQRYSGETRAW